MSMLPALPGNPEDRDQLVVTAPRRELVVIHEDAGTMIHVVEPVAAPTVAGGGLRAYIQATVPAMAAISGCGVSGPWVVASSTWRLSVPAAVGDVIAWAPAIALGGQGAAALDLAVIGSGGAPLRHLSSGTDTPADLGHAGLYVSGDYGTARLSVLYYRVQTGDLVAGALTLGLAYRDDPDGQMTVGHSQLVSLISALNLGPTSGVPGG